MAETHSISNTAYEPPRIEARTSLEGLLNPPIGSAVVISAAFRPL
jgi:hypothetical protein